VYHAHSSAWHSSRSSALYYTTLNTNVARYLSSPHDCTRLLVGSGACRHSAVGSSMPRSQARIAAAAPRRSAMSANECVPRSMTCWTCAMRAAGPSDLTPSFVCMENHCTKGTETDAAPTTEWRHHPRPAEPAAPPRATAPHTRGRCHAAGSAASGSLKAIPLRRIVYFLSPRHTALHSTTIIHT
jgi:hypothetical protein